MHSRLVEHLTSFKYYPDRAKVSGRMWGGNGEGTITDSSNKEHRFEVQVWWHGPDVDPGPERMKLEGATVEGWITPDGVYYDLAWFGYITDSGVWLRPKSEMMLSPLGNHRFVQPADNQLAAGGYRRVLAW